MAELWDDMPPYRGGALNHWRVRKTFWLQQWVAEQLVETYDYDDRTRYRWDVVKRFCTRQEALSAGIQMLVGGLNVTLPS